MLCVLCCYNVLVRYTTLISVCNSFVRLTYDWDVADADMSCSPLLVCRNTEGENDG
jgi:hypothetical protein